MAYGAVDPNILEAMLAYSVAPTTPSVDEDWQSAQGKYLTQLSKGGNAVMDLDTMISSGMLPAGAFDPMTTMEPVDAPGERQLANLRSGSPYQQWLAGKLDLKWNSGRILAELSKMVADPVAYSAIEPEAPNIVGELPPMLPYYDEKTKKMVDPRGPDGAPLPDLRAAGDEIRGFESAVQGDPEHTMVNGMPVTATTEDSAAMKAWHDAGFVSDPTAGYDPYMFAPAGVTPESDQQLADSEARWAKSKEVAGQNFDAGRSASTAADKAYRDWLKMMEPKSPEELAAIQARQVETEGPQRRGGIAGFLDDLPGDSGIADWMNRDRGPDTSRDKIPQRGGISDDMARIVEHPGKSIFGALGSLPGRISKIPGMIDRTTESAAGAADTGLGNTLEERFSGNAPLFSATGSVSGTSDFRLPDALTGNQGPNPLAQLPPYLSAGGPQIPGRTVAGLPGASAGGGQQRPGTPWGSQPIQQAMAKMVTNALTEGMKKKMLDAQNAQHQAALANNQSIQTWRDKSDANFLAKRHQQQRAAISAMLAAQGRSPARDEVNARNALAYGFGQ